MGEEAEREAWMEAEEGLWVVMGAEAEVRRGRRKMVERIGSMAVVGLRLCE